MVAPRSLILQGKISVSALFWTHSSLSTPSIKQCFTASMGQGPAPVRCGPNPRLQGVCFPVGLLCALEAIPSWTAALTKSGGLCPCQVHAVREHAPGACLMERACRQGDCRHATLRNSGPFFTAITPTAFYKQNHRVVCLFIYLFEPVLSW